MYKLVLKTLRTLHTYSKELCKRHEDVILGVVKTGFGIFFKRRNKLYNILYALWKLK